MPAHTSTEDIGKKRLSTGELLNGIDRQANAEADRLAKAAALGERTTDSMRACILGADARLTAIARWIGQCTALAHNFKLPDGTTVRDSAPRPVASRRQHREVNPKPKEEPTRVLGELPMCARWAALQARVLAKSTS